MKKELHEDARTAFKNISKILEDNNLSIEEREKFETLKSQLAGVLLSSWLPPGGSRKFIMFIITLIALYFLVQAAFVQMMIAVVILCMFSPRIVGKVAIFVGTVNGSK